MGSLTARIMTTASVPQQKRRRAYAPLILGVFFLVATKICFVAAFTLLAPGTWVDGIWAIKPAEYRQLLALGPLSGIGFGALSVVMALASIGTFLRSRRGWWLVVAIFAINGLGDATQMFFGRYIEGGIGVLAAALALFVITQPRIKSSFQR